MTWESARGLTIGRLVDLPAEQWDTIEEERSSPPARPGFYYGDRHQHLAFVDVDLDAAFLHRTFIPAPLTETNYSQDGQADQRGGDADDDRGAPTSIRDEQQGAVHVVGGMNPLPAEARGDRIRPCTGPEQN